ncbi:DUF4244 domain-containing protein [Nonomuraea typhae]|uniref:DUF4244 domain-containing protein n=1 Tax=Nonomuraea typhae TaxID=2603600 RepID=UPI0012FB4777|nr:DUF4244 domain-containing protein [Nonomuraea typhae]
MSTLTIQHDIAATPPKPRTEPDPFDPPADHPASPEEPEPTPPDEQSPKDANCRRWWPPTRTTTRPDAGMSTAEYAVGTLAAVAFALLLFKVINSPEVQATLAGVIDRALNSAA